MRRTSPQNRNIQPKAQLKALTGIRFFAALAVIAFHLYLAAPDTYSPYVASLASYGFIGVGLFFVLSGFVLAYNYINKPIDKRKFWVARFARVYPAYVLALVIGLLTYNEVANEIAQKQMPSWTTAWSTLQVLLEGTLLHTWFPWTACGINCPGWSVAVEAFFYAIFPFVAVVALKVLGKLTPTKTVIAIIILWVVSMIAPMASLLFVPDFLATRVYSLLFDALIYNPLLNAPQFLMGMCAGMLFVQKSAVRKDVNGHMPSRSFVLATVAGLAGLAVLMLVEPEHPAFTLLLRMGVFSPIFALLIYALAHGQGLLVKLLSLPPLMLLGEASYGIYILETPLNRVLKLISEAGWLPVYGSIPYGISFLLILIAVSIASLHLIETPARKYITQRAAPKQNALQQKLSRGGAERL